MFSFIHVHFLVMVYGFIVALFSDVPMYVIGRYFNKDNC